MLPLMLIDIVDRHDVRMIQVGGRFRFRAKSPRVLFRGQLTRQDHLQRRDVVGLQLTDFEDHSHSAAGDFFQQFVLVTQ